MMSRLRCYYLSTDQGNPLEKDTIIEKKSITTWRGVKIIFQIQYKEQKLSATRWLFEEAIEVEFP